MFFYSLPVFFSEIGWLRPWEFALFVLLSGVLFWLTAPQSKGDVAIDKTAVTTLRQLLLKAWLGRLSLGWVFWPFFLFLNGLFYTVDTLAKTGELTISSWDEIYFVLVTPIVFWTLCVWRNSANCLNRVWAAAARLVVLMIYFEYVLKWLMRINYPRLFFNCNELLLNYIACF